MTAHLNLPYNWEDCSNREACFKVLHVDLTSEELNQLPQQWIENMVGNCEIEDNYIAVFDENGEYHNDNGPALEVLRGARYWFVHGSSSNNHGQFIVESSQ